MALVVKDRVKETTATTGTGTLTLAGALTGFQSFSSALSDGDTTYYAIFESSTGEWEVGLGTFTLSGTTLARTTVLASSNSGSAVNLTAGSAEVFVTQPAGKAVYFDGSGDLTLNQDPTSALQAATKQYVDTIAAAGIHYHTPVRVESPTALTATYDNGTSGVGATLTNSGTQAALVIDGVTLNTSDRVLVYTQTNAAHNGVYTVTDTGSVSTNWVLTRATDADSYGASDPDALGEGDAFFVSAGDTGAGELYVMNTSGTITFGTTNINFAVIAETAVYSAGNGLLLTGTTFSVGAGTGVTVNANDIAIGQSVGTGDTVTFATVNANLTGNVTGNLTGNVTGNADTATAWATGRSLTLSGDVTGTATGIDGSGNISVTTTIAADSVALGTDTTGNYVATGAVSGNGLSGSASSEGATFTVTSNATNANTASTIVFRDASGNFSAGTITAALNGNATTATTATTANSVAANSVALGTDTTGNYVAAGATSGNGISGSVSSEGGTFTVTSNATNANTANTIVYRDASGNFSAGTITANLTGTASNADTLDGYNSSQSESVNTVAVRNASGYLFANYFNGSGTFATTGATSGMARFTGTNGTDTYGRSYTAQAAATLLSGSTMNISGTATNITAYTINQSVGTANSPTFSNLYVGDNIYHNGDTNTYMGFHAADQWRVVTGGTERFEINNSDVTVQSALKEKYVALSGTTPSVDVDAGGAFSLTTSGNTTFTFTAFTSGISGGFILQLTAGGTHTVTWPASVDWAGGTAPDAPASGETDLYVFWSRDGGTTWYGVRAIDAAA